jgi:acetyl-CoA synthetase
MVGLKEQTVKDAKSFKQAQERHRWIIPSDYNVTVDCLDRHVELRDRVALYYEEENGHSARYTFGELSTLSRRFANALRGLGIGRGDIVAVHLPQRPETAIAHMAFYRLGVIGLPISKLFGPDAIRYRLNDSGARAIVVEADNVEKVESIRKDTPNLAHIIVAGGKVPGMPMFEDLVSQGSADFTMEKKSSEDPILLMYTSGTTGNPKGVLHLARYVLGHNGIDYSYNFLRESDLYYGPADWAWAGGLLDGLLGIWPYGVPVLAYRSDSRFDPDVTFRLLEKYGASVGLWPPTALKRMREVQKPREQYRRLKLRCVASGAEPVSPELERWVTEELGCEFNQAFGQTEANYFIGNCSALEKADPEAVGKPYPGHEVAIVDDEGAPRKNGETGQIAIRLTSPVVMKEYWNNPEATRRKFVNGWCLTGDLGHMDDRGYVFFHGRSDDVIKSSGYRIGPAEIEAKIMEHRAVASCAVIGVPDQQRGQAVKAFVKLLPGVAPSRELIEEIKKHVKKALAAHECPREIAFIDEFPVTVTGKIMRRALREMEEKTRRS